MTQTFTGYSTYETFIATRTHVHSNGLAMMPTAGPYPQVASVVALHGGMCYESIACLATRKGEPPSVPSPQTRNQNRVYLRGGRFGDFPVSNMAGINTYTVGVWFLFGILAPEGLASDFYLGNLPFPGIDQNEFISSSYFNYMLVNQGPTQSIIPVPTQPPELQNIMDGSSRK